MKEKKKDRKKKRLFIVLLILLLIHIIAIGFIVGFVINFRKEDDDFNVEYTSTIWAEVTARYQIKGKEVVEVGKIVFDPSNGEHMLEILTFGDIDLSVECPSVEFTYIFKNNETTDCVVSLSDEALSHNITITYNVWCEGTVIIGSLQNEYVIPAGGTCIVSQLVEVLDTGHPAYYVSSDEGGLLTWDLSRAEQAEVADD